MSSSSQRRKEAETWCSDALHDLVGFADSALASYLVSVASSSSSIQAILQVLDEGGVDAPADKKQQFAQALHAKCSSSSKSVMKSSSQSKSKTNADWQKQAASYKLVEHDDEPTTITQEKTKSSKSKDKKERIREKKKRQRREYTDSDDDQDDAFRLKRSSTEERRDKRRERKKKGSALTPQEQADLEREKDLREREEFVARMMERDEKKTKNIKDDAPQHDAKKRLDVEERLARGETVIDEATGDAMTLEKLREQSRRAYLKKREERELTLLQQSLQDEEELFKDQKLTEAEKKKIALGKQILEMVQSRGEEEVDKNDGFYRLPDEYDEKGTKEEQDKALLTSRYVEPKHEKTEQDLWEESQTRKAAGLTHHKKAKKDEKQYDLVFEDQIDFVMQDTKKGYDDRDRKRIKEEPPLSPGGRPELEMRPATEHEKILAGRKKLPVYPYREEFLAAIKEHQTLILVGETGSGTSGEILYILFKFEI